MTVMTRDNHEAVSASIADDAHRVMALVYGEWLDVVFVDGKGCELVSDRGERFLDMTSGIAVTALGHRSPVVENALREAALGLTHTSNLYLTTPAIALAKELVRLSFADRAFFCNSGAEANEAVLKFARLAAGDTRAKVVYFDHSFHGRTFGALTATDKEAIRQPFVPLVPGFERANFAGRWKDWLRSMNTTACAIVEPVQARAVFARRQTSGCKHCAIAVTTLARSWRLMKCNAEWVERASYLPMSISILSPT